MVLPDPANPTGAPQVFYIHTDHLDAPRIVVDMQGHKRWRWLAEHFGATAPETNPEGLGVFTQNLRFPGQYADAESGLFDNYFRYLDSSSGRYVASDAIGLEAGLNTFSYVDSNPTFFVDADGLQAQRAPIPRLTYNQSYTNASANIPLTQIRAYQPGYGYGQISPSNSAGYTAQNVAHLQSVLQRLQRNLSCPIREVIDETNVRRGTITSSTPLTEDELLRGGEIFLGPNYTEIGKPGSGVFRS